MKKFLAILVLGLLLSGNAYAGFLKDFITSWGKNSTAGCAYDSLGREIECVTIEYGEDGGLTYTEAKRSCVRYLRRFVNLEEGTIGGCI